MQTRASLPELMVNLQTGRPTRACGTPMPKHVNLPPPKFDLAKVNLDSPAAQNLQVRPKRQYQEDSKHEEQSQDDDSEDKGYSGLGFVGDKYRLRDDLIKLRF
jgi:hypothetical protein